MLLGTPVNGVVKSGTRRSLWESGVGLNHLQLTVFLRATGEAAHAAMREPVSAPPSPDTSERRIGEGSWARFELGYGSVRFVLGRAAVSLNVYPVGGRIPGDEPVISQLDAHMEVARTLARGLEWVIGQHAELMVDTDGSRQRTVVASGMPVSAPALTFGNVAWTLLDAFRQAGAELTWDAIFGKATVSYCGSTVELIALRGPARVNGKDLVLGAGVMLARSGPIVPRRKSAEALGMKVRVTKTAIEIG